MRWSYASDKEKELSYIILVGVFSIGDLIGKTLPEVYRHPRLRRFNVSARLLLILVLLRLLFVVFFLCCMFYTNHIFFNSFYLYSALMLLLSITNGYCATTAITGACNSVKRYEEKEIVGPAAVLLLLLGIACGVYSAYLY